MASLLSFEKQGDLYFKRYEEWSLENNYKLDFFICLQKLYFPTRNKEFPNFSNKTFLSVLENSYKIFIHETREESKEIHLPFSTLQIRKGDKEIFPVPIKSEIGKGDFDHILQI